VVSVCHLCMQASTISLTAAVAARAAVFCDRLASSSISIASASHQHRSINRQVNHALLSYIINITKLQTKEKVERRIRDEPVVDAPNLIPAHILAAAAAAAASNAAHTTAGADTDAQQQQAAYDAAFDEANDDNERYDDNDSVADNDGVGWWSSLPDSVQYTVQGVFMVCAVMLVMVLRSRKSSAK
jgi:hypothetical protein